jgi:ABC-type polysaccharide/polyol phosphate transport system ATPase subunit
VSAAAVSVRGLCKLFHHHLPRYRTMVGRLRCAWEGGDPEIPAWALRGVSFEVGRGECLGVTGPNGAGKSTLLALIAGILEPTAGSIRVEGRANTFFNLLAGLQGELSVRDNIEICGVLMGLRRREILGRVDAVLDFAELSALAEVRMAELSTGQAARVAFAAAIHSDLDILLVDEVLSVGDRAFQEKCRQAFARLRREGKTLIVVSHDDALLRSLAPRILRLEGGRASSSQEGDAAREPVRG